MTFNFHLRYKIGAFFCCMAAFGNCFSADLITQSITQGGMHGGGGVGIRCDGVIEVLDLYEGRKSGLEFLREPDSDEKAIRIASKRFAQHFTNPETISESELIPLISERYIAPIFNGKNGVFKIYNPDGSETNYPVIEVDSLPLSNDVGNIQIPSNCHLEQIIFFDDQNKSIKIASRKYNELTRLDRMALSIHELIYWWYRANPMSIDDPTWGKDRVITSQESREFTSRLLSKLILPTKSSLLPNPNYVPDACSDYNYQNPNEIETAFYSTKMAGRYYWSFKILYNYWTPYLTYIEFNQDLTPPLFDIENGQIDALSKIMINDGNIKEMGLALEVKKRPGYPANIRILDNQGNYLDDAPINISCDKGESWDHLSR